MNFVRCEKCHFFEKTGTGQNEAEGRSYGLCHRYPPTVTQTEPVFPEVWGHVWCGEFKRAYEGVAALSAPPAGEKG